MLASPCAFDTSSGNSRVFLPALLLLQLEKSFCLHLLCGCSGFSICIMSNTGLQSAKYSHGDCSWQSRLEIGARNLLEWETIVLYLRLTRAFILRWTASKPSCITCPSPLLPPPSLQQSAKACHNGPVTAESESPLYDRMRALQDIRKNVPEACRTSFKGLEAFQPDSLCFPSLTKLQAPCL